MVLLLLLLELFFCVSRTGKSKQLICCFLGFSVLSLSLHYLRNEESGAAYIVPTKESIALPTYSNYAHDTKYERF